MTKLRAAQAIGLGFGGALVVVGPAGPQMPLPAAKPSDPAPPPSQISRSWT